MLTQITQQADSWHFSGALVIDKIVDVIDASKALSIPKNLQLNFSDVTEVDTSAISLIFELKRRALAQKSETKLVNTPANLVSLMKLYGVDEFVVKN